MKELKINLDDDLVEYVSKETDESKFVNDCLREKMKADNFVSTPKQETTSSDNQKKGPEIEPKKNEINYFKIIMAFIGVLILICIIVAAFSNSNTKKLTETIADSSTVDLSDLDAAAASQSGTKNEVRTWSYNNSQDEMTDSKNTWASITSDNFATFDFPYEGGSELSITVRYMKKYGYDVILKITPGQFNGDDYNGTNYVTVRFDNGSPRKYTFSEPQDGSSDQIFINKSSDFIARCKRAKSIKIEAPFYQEGRVVFDFTMDKPLVWK